VGIAVNERVRTGLVLRADPKNGFVQVVGVGGIGSGMMIALEGDQTLGRNESRMGRALEARDYCKLHIVEHSIAVLMGAEETRNRFQVFAVGNVGADAAGGRLIEEMAAVGINMSHVRIDPERTTLFSVAFQYPDKSGGNITTSNSAASALNEEQINESRSELARAADKGIALCLPEVPLAARRDFLRVATECGSYRVASFSSGEMEAVRECGLLAQVDLLALNSEEAAAMAGQSGSVLTDEQLLEAVALAGQAAHAAMKILVSAGAKGVFVFEAGRWSHHQALPTKVVSTAGAGDALLAGTIAGLAAGLPLSDRQAAKHMNDDLEMNSAIDIGRTLAAFSVTSPHSIHPEARLERLLAFVRERGMVESELFKGRCSIVNECEPFGQL